MHKEEKKSIYVHYWKHIFWDSRIDRKKSHGCAGKGELNEDGSLC